jgi:hypothetical protein
VEPLVAQSQPLLESGFRQMYSLQFDAARKDIAAYQRQHAEDPLGIAAEAASHLFEEFVRQGVLTSDFFLNDDKLLGGVKAPTDGKRNEAFLAANQRARKLAETILKTHPEDANALFALSLADGMEGDFQALIEKRQLASLSLIRRAERTAARLLALKPDAVDAYVALGAANYIIGCLPAYKRMVLWFGRIRGDRVRGMDQLGLAAQKGHYLRPLAKVLLALAFRRENQPERARALLEGLHREFPSNALFKRELELLR